MSTWMKSMTDAAKSAGNQASVMAHTTKIKAEITLLESKIAGMKGDWGQKCFDAFTAGNHRLVQEQHQKAKKHVDAEVAKLEAKKRELEAAKAPTATPVVASAPVTVASMPVATPVAVRQTMAITVPPDAHPGQQIAVVLPSGQQIQAIVPPTGTPGTVFHIEV